MFACWRCLSLRGRSGLLDTPSRLGSRRTFTLFEEQSYSMWSMTWKQTVQSRSKHHGNMDLLSILRAQTKEPIYYKPLASPVVSLLVSVGIGGGVSGSQIF
eukprot:6461501-Amphidinium_carterae.1